MKKKIIGIILCVATAAMVGVCGTTASAFAYDLTISDWGIEYFNKLDTGIYWYANPDDDVPTSDYTVQKDKPTIIFTHGWKPSGESRVREGLSLKTKTEGALKEKGFDEYKYDSEFYRYYIEKGYNVGVFYWNQLADAEGKKTTVPSFSVDEKIWTSNGGKNMTYITYDSPTAEKGTKTSSDDPTNPKKSVAVIFGEAIVEALGKDFSGTLQIAGHSMGGQLTLAASEYLCLQKDKGNIGENLLPDRVTLLDPYLNALTRWKKDITVDHSEKVYKYENGVDVFTVEFAADAAETIGKHGIPIEGYAANTSMVVQNYKLMGTSPEYCEKMDSITKKLQNNCVWVYAAGLGLYGGFDPTHVMSVDWYFSTNNMKVVKSDEGLEVPSAQLETEKLQSLIGLTFRQSTPSGVNPLYYDMSSYSIVNFDTMKPYESDEAQGVIFGKVNINGNGKNLNVKLIDSESNVVADAEINAAGYYHIFNVAEGQYELKIFAGKTEIESAGQINVTNTPIPTVANEIEVTVNSVDFYQYVIVALVCMIAVAVIIAIICLCIGNSRKRVARKNG